MVTLERPQLLLVAGLAALGALYALTVLLGQLDRCRMVATTTDELERLPLTDDDSEVAE